MNTFWEKVWENRNFVAQIFISIIILTVSLIMIFMLNEDDGRTKWAMGMIGIVVGYWLK